MSLTVIIAIYCLIGGEFSYVTFMMGLINDWGIISTTLKTALAFIFWPVIAIVLLNKKRKGIQSDVMEIIF